MCFDIFGGLRSKPEWKNNDSISKGWQTKTQIKGHASRLIQDAWRIDGGCRGTDCELQEPWDIVGYVSYVFFGKYVTPKDSQWIRIFY